MAKEKEQECPPVGAPAWMATYGDMVTNLLCFFVLLFSMSSISEEKFQQFASSYNSEASFFDGGIGILDPSLPTIGLPESVSTIGKNPVTDAKAQEDIESFEKALEEYQEKNNSEFELKYNKTEAGIEINLDDKILFDSGQVKLKQEAFEVLNFVYELLQKKEFSDRMVRIEGHTDNVPTLSSVYPTNWELSAIRATNVLRYFVEEKKLSPERFIVAGYGEYKPIATNDTVEGRKLNRRVNIVLLSNKDNKK